MHRILRIVVIGSILLAASVVAARQTSRIATSLVVSTDSVDNLKVVDGGACSGTGQSTIFPNAFLSTDASGNLKVCGSGGGNVTGPGSSTDTAIALWNGTGGTVLKNSAVTIDTSGNVSIPAGSNIGDASNRYQLWGNFGLLFNNVTPITWTNSSAAGGGTIDVGIVRNAAGVLEINNGAAGTFRDLKLRSIGVNAAPTGTNGQLAMSSTVTTYNNIATAGVGVGAIYAAPLSTGNSAAVANFINYTPPAAVGTYQIAMNIDVTAWTTPAASTVTCTYKDPTGASRTETMTFKNLAGTINTSIAATGQYSAMPLTFGIDASGTAITCSTVTFTGTPTYAINGYLMQVR